MMELNHFGAADVRLRSRLYRRCRAGFGASIAGEQLWGLTGPPSSLHRHNFDALAAAGRQRTAENAVGTRI